MLPKHLIQSMGRTVYLPTFKFMVNVGKYTVRPMDAMGLDLHQIRKSQSQHFPEC